MSSLTNLKSFARLIRVSTSRHSLHLHLEGGVLILLTSAGLDLLGQTDNWLELGVVLLSGVGLGLAVLQ